MTRTLSRSLAGGEITPELFGRIDLDKMQTGLKKCRNMIIKPHGPAKSRGGFKFLNFCKYNARKARLIRFQFSSSDSMIIELGHLYARFHNNLGTETETNTRTITSVTDDSGVRVLVTLDPATPLITAEGMTVFISGTGSANLDNRFFNVEYVTPITFFLMDQLGNYIDPASMDDLPVTPTTGKVNAVFEVATPYDEADLFSIRFTQSLDVITFTHPSYPPATLSRSLDALDAVTWEYAAIDFEPESILEVPTNLRSTLIGITHPAPSRYSYVVTSVDDNGREESIPSVPNRQAANNAINKIEDILNWADQYVADATKVPASPTEDEADQAIFNLVSLNLDEGDEVVLTDMPTGWDDLNDRVFTVNEIIHEATDRYTLQDTDGEVIRTSGRPVFVTGPSYCREAGISADLSHAGNAVRLKWTKVSGVSRYNVYKRQGVSYFYGYIGQSKSPRFTDKNIVADLTKSPPEAVNYFATDYPAAVTYYDQRKVFAGTGRRPQTAWLTRPYTESNISSSFPVRPDDSIMITAKTNEASTILHAVSLNDIVLLTSGGEIRVRAEGDVLTPTSASAKAQSYIGAAEVQPVMSNRAAIFVENGGNALRELVYKGDVENSYESQNISIMAPHLFESPIVDLAFMRGVDPVVWAVREDGVLVGATYVPEQRVIAYHQHDTNGEIESVATAYSTAVPVAAVGGTTTPSAEGVMFSDAADVAMSSLIDAGIWSRLDRFGIFAGDATEANGLMDWKNPAKGVTLNGSATWTQADGIVGSGVTDSYADTGYTPLADAVNYTQTSSSFFVYTKPRVSYPASGNLVGTGTVDGTETQLLESTGGAYQLLVDGLHKYTGASVVNDGFICVNRPAANTIELYKNGVSIPLSGGGTCSTLTNRPLRLISDNAEKVMAWGCGGEFTDTEQLAIKAIIDTYLASV